MSSDQGRGAAGEVAHSRWALKDYRSAAHNVLPNQSRCAAGDVLWQAKQPLADDCHQRNCGGTFEKVSLFHFIENHSALIERCGAIVLRRRALRAQANTKANTKEGQQHHEYERIRRNV